MQSLYDSTAGNPMQFRDMYAIGEGIGLSRDETNAVANYLEAENLIKFWADQGLIGITHEGVVRAEASQMTSQPGSAPAAADQRRNFLEALYRAVEGSRLNVVNVYELGKQLGLSTTDVDATVEYLEGEGLLRYMTLGGGLALTHEGVVRAESDVAERALAPSSPVLNPEEPFEIIPLVGGASLRIPRSLTGISQTPGVLLESMERFRADHPDPSRVGFIIMQFHDTRAHREILAAIKSAVEARGLKALRADDRQYHASVFPNVQTYMHGCGFGIAVFERIEAELFNPNVSLEVGYMMGLKKEVCLLKDKTLKTLHTDVIDRLYNSFDPQDATQTIPPQIDRWLNDWGPDRKPG